MYVCIYTSHEEDHKRANEHQRRASLPSVIAGQDKHRGTTARTSVLAGAMHPTGGKSHHRIQRQRMNREPVLVVVRAPSSFAPAHVRSRLPLPPRVYSPTPKCPEHTGVSILISGIVEFWRRPGTRDQILHAEISLLRLAPRLASMAKPFRRPITVLIPPEPHTPLILIRRSPRERAACSCLGQLWRLATPISPLPPPTFATADSFEVGREDLPQGRRLASFTTGPQHLSAVASFAPAAHPLAVYVFVEREVVLPVGGWGAAPLCKRRAPPELSTAPAAHPRHMHPVRMPHEHALRV